MPAHNTPTYRASNWKQNLHTEKLIDLEVKCGEQPSNMGLWSENSHSIFYPVNLLYAYNTSAVISLHVNLVFLPPDRFSGGT